MSTTEQLENLTQLLTAAQQGDQVAAEQAWHAVYGEMHAMARRACSAEGARANLQPTLLVHEIYLKMFGPEAAKTAWEDRRHFWCSVGRAIGQFLIDLARTEGRLRRGGDRSRIPMDIVAGELEDPARAISPGCVEALEALERLERESPECAEVARMRFLSGFSIEQTAALLGIAPRTVSKRWKFARAWLRRAVSEPVDRMD